nr:elongin-A [Cryptococcus depauperatus CBS 7855]
MPEHLEYTEEELEDLIGSDGDQDLSNPTALANINPSIPIAATFAQLSPSKATLKSAPSTKYPHISSSSSVSKNDIEARLSELRNKKKRKEVAAKVGTRTLKNLCMEVIQANSSRIWNIGDLEYSLVKPFIDELPFDQLVEIESNSPHIQKDTDWLWEIFILQDFRLFYVGCRENHGEPRTSGWRKMYKRAREDAAERQLQAADRVAARYKQLEDEKKSKSIVFLDKAIPDKRPRGTRGKSRTGVANSRRELPPISEAIPFIAGIAASKQSAGAASAIAKARAEAQRARISLTHASGRYIPPTKTQTQAQRLAQNQLFKNPFLLSSSVPQTRPVSSTISRIPPPRSVRISKANSMLHESQYFASSPIPGSFPTSQSSQFRASLPSHLINHQSSSSSASKERFIIDGVAKKELKEIRKPQVENFEAPKLKKEKGKEKVDFFGNNNKADGGGIFRVKKRKAGQQGAEASPVKRPALGH